MSGSTLVRGLIVALATALSASPALAGGLSGSRRSMVHQHAIAVGMDYSFARTKAQLEHLVADSALEPVTANADFTLAGVSFPYARAEVRDFVVRLAAAYHRATGTPLVVTSLARPTSLQPRNASPLSVHPAGMAVDLRVPDTETARTWLAHTLLTMENAGVLDVTREHHPSHFHVAVFPALFARYAAREDSAAARAGPAAVAGPALRLATVAPLAPGGDSWPRTALLVVLVLAATSGAAFVARRRF